MCASGRTKSDGTIRYQPTSASAAAWRGFMFAFYSTTRESERCRRFRKRQVACRRQPLSASEEGVAFGRVLFEIDAKRIESAVANRDLLSARSPHFDPPFVGGEPDVGDDVVPDLDAAATAETVQTQAELVEQFLPIIPV